MQVPTPDLHGGGLARPVVAEEGGDLPLVEVQVEVLHRHLPVGVDLVQVLDRDAWGVTRVKEINVCRNQNRQGKVIQVEKLILS